MEKNVTTIQDDTAPAAGHMGALPPEDTMWRAVLERDARFDGDFVYGVRSTRIFCRSTCPSRRPRRDGVTFFALSEQAVEAGFRPCLRCRPGEPRGSGPTDELVARICHHIEVGVREGTDLRLETLGAHFGLSPFYLQRLFKSAAGVTPRAYAEAQRIGLLKVKLKEGDNVATALYDAGYNSSNALYNKAPARLGMTPGSYRKGGAGETITYAAAESPVGWVLVARTVRGVCAITLGDTEPELEQSLRTEYPRASLRRDDQELQHELQAVIEHLQGARSGLDLPLDVQSTAFQRRVWDALLAIPYGSTRSYSEVASSIGSPKAVRAVARACASNRLALAIPCHRVVREDGSLGGYRWGLGRKKAILQIEEAELHPPARDSARQSL